MTAVDTLKKHAIVAFKGIEGTVETINGEGVFRPLGKPYFYDNSWRKFSSEKELVNARRLREERG